jgi:cytochrome c oxidase subunit 4
MNLPPITPRKTYIFVYVGLMTLLVTTTGLAFLPLGPFHTPVAVGIALTKAFLVALFFMHLRYGSGRTRLLLCVGLLLLIILVALTLADYVTRVNGLPFTG